MKITVYKLQTIKLTFGTSLEVQWLVVCASTAGYMGL